MGNIYLHDHKIFLDVAKTTLYLPQPKYNLAAKLCYEDYLRRVSFLIQEDEKVERLDVPLETVALRKKTLFIANLPCYIEISNIIDFFKDVGQVIHVRLIVNHEGTHVSYSYVEFASANEAEKALEKKKGEYLHDHKIFLENVKKTAPPPKYCIDYKVWYEDYLRQENVLIEEDEEVEGLDETVEVTKKTVFVANLHCETGILNIIHFFKDVGEVVRVRIIVNHKGEHVRCAFVEFASTNKVNKALKKRNKKRNGKIFLDMAKTAPYPLRPKYNLAEKLWYERQESLVVEEDEAVEALKQTPKLVEDPDAFKEKTVFVTNLCYETEISDIISFFKDVGEVVHVRLVVNHASKLVSFGFVEFASADEANKSLEKKNGEYLHDRKIIVDETNFKYSIDHKVWYHEDYLPRFRLETKPKRKKPKMVEQDYSKYGEEYLPGFHYLLL